MPSGVGACVDLEVGELGDVFGDGVRGEPLAFFVELHHGDAGDGLGHGVVAEDGGFGHGDFLFDVLPAVGAVVDDFAVAREDGDDAGDLMIFDSVLHEGVKAGDSVAGKADGSGRDGRHVDCGRGLLGKTGQGGEGGCGEGEGGEGASEETMHGKGLRMDGTFIALEREKQRRRETGRSPVDALERASTDEWALVDEFERELDLAGSACGFGDDAESVGNDGVSAGALVGADAEDVAG